MANQNRSLNALIDVPQLLQLLRLLGCRVSHQGLPLQTRCPICREGLLTVLRDQAAGGGWHRCEKCGSQGDLIALAAAALNVTVPEAIAHLAARGFSVPADDASVRRYLAEHVEYDRRLNKLWEASRTARHRPPEFSALAKRMGLNPEGWPSRWPDGIGQIIGSLTKTSVEEAFAPGVMQQAKVRRNTGSTSGFRVFAGKDWDIVAGMPFFDLPGRIASVLFVGRNGDPKQDFVLKRASRGTLGNQHCQVDAEAGLAFHPGIFAAADATDRTVLAVGDPLLMLKLQARHFRSGIRPLPVVGWLDSDQWPGWDNQGRRTRTSSAWQMLCAYTIVFWAPMGIDVYTLRQAIAADAWISTAGPRRNTVEALKEFLWKRPPAELSRHIIEQARPWPEALTKDLEQRKVAALSQWLIQIEHEQEPLAPILARCEPHVQERVNRILSVAMWPRTIEFNGRTIVEANRCWSLQRNGRPASLICDAILRVDRVVSEPESGVEMIDGRILYQDHEIPFRAALKDFEQDPFAYMRRVVLEEGLGLPNCDRRYSKHALRIALTFEPLQQHEPVLRVGFDHGTGRLTLPQITIDAGGEVEATTAALVLDYLPAANLSLPQEPAEIDFRAAAENPELARIAWGTIACVVANVFALEFQNVPAGLCLAGEGAQTLGTAVAEALGCTRFKVDRAAGVRVALDAERIHRWPMVVEVRPGLHRRHLGRLLKCDESGRRCILSTDWVTSRLLLLRDGWHVVTCESPVTVPESVLQMASTFLPAYLRDLIRRCCRLHDECPNAPLPLRILEDIADFVEAHGGDAEPVLAAADVLLVDGDVDRGAILVEVLARLVSENKLQIGSKPDASAGPMLLDVPDSDALVLTHLMLVAALRRLPVNLLDREVVDQLLRSSGLLQGTVRGAWLLKRSALLSLAKERTQQHGRESPQNGD